MNVWAVLFIQENGSRDCQVFRSAEEAGMEAAAWLGNTNGAVDGYVPDLVNAANEGDDSEFVSDDGIWFVQIFKRIMGMEKAQ